METKTPRIYAAGRYVGATAALNAGSTPLNLLDGVHTGVGDCLIALGHAIDENKMSVNVSRESALSGTIGYTIVDGTHIRVVTFTDAGAAVDCDFSIKVTLLSGAG